MITRQAVLVAVNKSRNIEFYNDAANCRIALMYTPREIEARDYVPKEKFMGEYWVPPNKARDLYDLICKDTPSGVIIFNLGLERKLRWEVEDWLKKQLDSQDLAEQWFLEDGHHHSRYSEEMSEAEVESELNKCGYVTVRRGGVDMGLRKMDHTERCEFLGRCSVFEEPRRSTLRERDDLRD